MCTPRYVKSKYNYGTDSKLRPAKKENDFYHKRAPHHHEHICQCQRENKCSMVLKRRRQKKEFSHRFKLKRNHDDYVTDHNRNKRALSYISCFCVYVCLSVNVIVSSFKSNSSSRVIVMTVLITVIIVIVIYSWGNVGGGDRCDSINWNNNSDSSSISNI